MYPLFALRVIPVILVLISMLISTQGFSIIIFLGLAVAHIGSHWIGSSSSDMVNPYMKCGPNHAYAIAPPFVSAYLPWTTVTYSYLCAYMATLITISNRSLYNTSTVIGLTGLLVVDALWLWLGKEHCYRWREILIALGWGALMGSLWAYVVGKPVDEKSRNLVYYGHQN